MNLQRLVEYQIWADDQARDLLRGLTDEEFSKDVLPPFGSIRSLCAHITLAISTCASAFAVSLSRIEANIGCDASAASALVIAPVNAKSSQVWASFNFAGR